MKKLILVGVMFCFCAGARGQNIEGQIIASEYGKWRVPGFAANTYSSFAPNSCRVQGGASFFYAFTVGTAVNLVDGNPALNETLTPTATVETDVTCSVTIAPANDHELPFYFTSGTGGLQEALNENLTTPESNTVILDSTWYGLVGGPTAAANVIAAAKGSAMLGLVDITTVPTSFYTWNGSQYVRVSGGGGGGSVGGLGTLANDLVANNAANTAAQDLYDFVATGTYTPQAAVNAAAANNGSVILQPGAGRVPFSNSGNYRVQDNRIDVPATARGVTEFGAACDLRAVYGTLISGSKTVTIGGGAFTAADVGREIVAVGSVGGVPTVFATTVVSITDSLHAVVTTAAPFSQATAHSMDLGHDDTAAIAQAMNAVGAGGTLVFPAGICLTHTQSLKGQSPIGLGISSQIAGFPGEDIFAAPDPSQGAGVNQGAAHIHDLTLLVDSRIDATQAWQFVTDTGTTAKAALYRPIAQMTGITNDPLAPGWFQGPGSNLGGAFNGVAAISGGSAVMCVAAGETAPAVGQEVVFPYLASVFTATVSSTAGSCSGGATARTLSAALPSGATSAQAEWFAGTSAQNLATAISAGSCPTSITLSNSINPVAGYEANVAPFGLIQIDGEQIAYFGRSNAGNTTPANTFYGIQCAQNGTARASHAAGATVVPLNRFKPAYPWPVTPSVNSGDTTPSATAGYFPGWNVGNAGFAFPVANGSTYTGGTGAWTANAKIENLSFFPWPNEINGLNWQEVNNTAMMYAVTPSYATTFANLFGLYLFYGIATGPPSLENHQYYVAQPTGDGTHYDGLQIWAANPINITAANQNTFSNFNVYSSEQTTAGATLGADTCMYFTPQWDDQTGGWGPVVSLSHFKNLYCEPEAGPHGVQMPNWEWDTFNSEIEDQHMGGGGEVYIGGNQQHWIGGNFNQATNLPAIVWGTQNTSDYVTILGSEPKSNSYGSSALINFGWGNRFSGTTSQSFSTPTGPYGALQLGNSREPIRAQTADTFFTGNLTAPYVSPEGGFITPEEFNASFRLESSAMSQGWTYDPTSPITGSYVGCNLGNNPVSTYCVTYTFNSEGLPIGPGQRLTPGKYTLYISAKDAVATSNSAVIKLFSNCGSYLQPITIPLKNTWPVGLANFVQAPVDLSSVTGSSTCYLGVQFFGATTADQIQIGFFDFAPVAEELNAQTINATTINLPAGPTGSTATGCAQSPVTGINGGYTCPTKGWSSTLTANQGVSDSSVTVSSTAGLSPAGCFFVDGEYECYTGISGSMLTGLTRGAYTTTAATHNSGATVVSVDLVLGSVLQAPLDVVTYGGSEAPILGVNNATPYNHGGSSVLSINNGPNETWVDTAGALHQTNTAVQSVFSGSIMVGGSLPVQPPLAQTGYLLQTNGPNTAYSPMTLGGGHAGSLNVIATPTIGAPTVFNTLPAGASSASWVCAGTDFDGNLIPGTTTTLSGVATTWSYPQGTTVACPWAAGVNTYQIYRTAGGSSQGLLASGVGPGFSVSDYGGATLGGTPPASNGSNPHFSVAGTGTPSIQLGPTNISSGAGAPTSTCGTAPIGSGSLWLRTDGGASTSVYACAGTSWTAVTIP